MLNGRWRYVGGGMAVAMSRHEVQLPIPHKTYYRAGVRDKLPRAIVHRRGVHEYCYTRILRHPTQLSPKPPKLLTVNIQRVIIVAIVTDVIECKKVGITHGKGVVSFTEALLIRGLGKGLVVHHSSIVVVVTNDGIYGDTQSLKGTLHTRQELHGIPHHIARKEYRCGVSRITILVYDDFDMWYNISFKGNHLRLGLRLWVSHDNKVKTPILALLSSDMTA